MRNGDKHELLYLKAAAKWPELLEKCWEIRGCDGEVLKHNDYISGAQTLYVCMYVCMYACMHVCMYVRMNACMCACMHACV